MSKMSAWLVLPTYNESLNILSVLDKIFAVAGQLTDFDLRVVVVDSASPDGTADLVLEFNKQHQLGENLQLVTEKRRGLGQAYDTGFAFAIQKGADVLIEMDADLSHDPAVLPSLLAPITEGADLVIGSRYVAGGFIPGAWPVKRVINSRAARLVARVVGGVSNTISDPTAGYKAIRASALQQIGFVAAGATGYVIQVKMVDMFYKAGLKIKEVPIVFADRQFGESKIRFKDIWQFVVFCMSLRALKVQNLSNAVKAEEQAIVDVIKKDEEIIIDGFKHQIQVIHPDKQVDNGTL